MLDDMIHEGLVTLETVELIVFRAPDDEDD
jgi:hypothetical protein